MTQISQAQSVDYCSVLSEQANEQLLGSAAEVTVWLVLEYSSGWGAKAVPESNLPASVKDLLAHWEATIPGVRVQFAKQRASTGDGAVTFFVALAQEENPQLFRFDLADCEELLTLDLPAVIARDPAYQANLHNEPLFLVCTNGKRDLCCAKFGLPVYTAMAAYAGEQVWRTTHIGGHRFAPTLVALPHGLTYGRVTTDEAAQLVDAYRTGHIFDLDRYRGRSCFSPVLQAADGYLRQRTGTLEIDAFRFVSLEQSGDSAWEVIFLHRKTDVEHTISLEEVEVGRRNPASCGQPKLAGITEIRVRS